MNRGGTNCNWNEAVVRVRAHISANKQYYFPAEIEIDSDSIVPFGRLQGYGGWGDPRDHKLCLSFVHDK